MNLEFYLITTEHLEDQVLFRDDEDFAVGMNIVAVLQYVLGVDVLAFILMSNHTHFVVQCSRDKAQLFIDRFKKQYSFYFQRKYGEPKLLKKTDEVFQQLDPYEESIERAIAYVHMNSVVANICARPEDYIWGSGNCFFKSAKSHGIPLSSFSKRKRIKLLHTCIDLPTDYVIENGFILPESYINVEFVQKKFGSPRRMNYFLYNSSKAKKKFETDDVNKPAFRDQIIKAAIPDLCRTLFDTDSLADLDPGQLQEMLRQIQYRFSSGIKQLARVTGMTVSKVLSVLEKV